MLRAALDIPRMSGLVLIGGTPGAYAGRALFRHKTRKQPFSARLHTIAVFQIVLAAFVAYHLR